MSTSPRGMPPLRHALRRLARGARRRQDTVLLGLAVLLLLGALGGLGGRSTVESRALMAEHALLRLDQRVAAMEVQFQRLAEARSAGEADARLGRIEALHERLASGLRAARHISADAGPAVAEADGAISEMKGFLNAARATSAPPWEIAIHGLARLSEVDTALRRVEAGMLSGLAGSGASGMLGAVVAGALLLAALLTGFVAGRRWHAIWELLWPASPPNPAVTPREAEPYLRGAVPAPSATAPEPAPLSLPAPPPDIPRAVSPGIPGTAFGTSGTLYDPVTGLPTRRKLGEHVLRLSAHAETPGQRKMLIHFLLEDFRDIEGMFGREVADMFLCHVADTLRGACGTNDLAVRSGEVEFLLLCVGPAEMGEALDYAQSLQMLLSAKTAIGRHDLSVPVTAGVALGDGDAVLPELVAEAGSALDEARRLGKGRLSLFTADLSDRLRRRRKTADDLRQAIPRDEIEPFFQPQIDALTGRVAGFEALVRWRHPERGVLAPWQFLEIAGDSGLASQIGAVMRERSFAQLAAWKADGLDVPRIGVNVTAAELREGGFVDSLLFDVDRAGLQPADVCVELLESAMIESRDDPVIKVLGQLSAAGFRVELDDFGTGHASISNLHRIHVDGIKIDRSFVMKLDERPEQQKLTSAMLSLSAALQIDSIAEGVETEAERALLIGMGCRVLQGFAIGRPMTGDDATRWLRTHAGTRPQAEARTQSAEAG